jgi:hypothetical protein
MSPIGGKDWSFKSSVRCPHLNATNFPLHSVGKGRPQLIPTCSKDKVSLIENKDANKSFPIFKFPDMCLKKVIDKFCSKGFVVPNILHYIWFGKANFEFMYFVAVYSAYKSQKPCLIFMYYDDVPKSVWWDLLLSSVPNIVQVKMDPPSVISGKKIKYIQHKADIIRLQVLKGGFCRCFLIKKKYVQNSFNILLTSSDPSTTPLLFSTICPFCFLALAEKGISAKI